MDNECVTKIYGANFDEFCNSLSKVTRSLPAEQAKRLWTIRGNYFGWYGFEGAYKRLNDRTIAQIFAEYREMDTPPIESGEVDGIKYRLNGVPEDDGD